MQKPIVKSFEIRGLHGYKDVRIEFDGPVRIIIAENGTGKTTILAALHAFLKRDFFKLASVGFDEMRCVLEGTGREFSLARAEIQAIVGSGSDTDIERLARYCSWPTSAVRQAILDLAEPSDFMDSPVLHEIYTTSPFDGEEFTEMLASIRQATELPKPLADLKVALESAMSGYQLLYLPTYRRIELPSATSRRAHPLGRARQRDSEDVAGIRFGLRDVQDRLAEILKDIQRYSNSQYRTISAAIIDDALGGKINAVDYKQAVLPDIDSLRLFFSRVETSKTNRLESLKKLYESGEIHHQDQLILRYFLSQLGAVVGRTKQLESNVEKFVEKINVYLNLSSDEKTLTYDSNQMRVIVRNNFNGDEIDLDALSSGEKQVISLFSHLYLEPSDKLILIDEPELSLSIDWQKRLLPDVMSSPSCAQLLAITHSPFIFDNELDPYAGPMHIVRRMGGARK